jgi:acetoin utilization deacetylase AcuC-like enzyme
VSCARCLAERLPGYLDQYRPDIVLYDAGVDVHGDDGLGRLAMTDEGGMHGLLIILVTA